MRKTKKTVYFRRKREKNTNYKKRINLLKSEKSRLVIRVTSNMIIANIIAYEAAGDKVLASSSSKDIKKLGLSLKGNNIPVSYLVGYHLGQSAKKAKIDDIILDTGLRAPIKGSRLFAALKGVIDAGIKVACSEDILPSEDRIMGKHIAEYAKALKTDTTRYQKQFSAYIKKGIEPEKIPELIKAIKQKID